MTCHCLVPLVFAVSCFASSSCNVGDIASLQVTYPARVLHTSQEECPSDDQQQIVRAETKKQVGATGQGKKSI